MTSPEHHIDGAHVNAPTPPADMPTALRPGDENDWLEGETEADREIRLRQLGVTSRPAPEDGGEDDLAAKWAEQQGDEGAAPSNA